MEVNTGIKHCSKRFLSIFFALTVLLLFPVLMMAIPGNDTGGTAPGTPPEWVLDKTVGNVEFYHAIIVCDGNKAVFLKFNNKNTHSVKVSWKEVFGTKAEAKRDGFAGRKELMLRPGVTMPESCADETNKKIVLLSSQVNPAAISEIVDFSFKEISVNSL